MKIKRKYVRRIRGKYAALEDYSVHETLRQAE